MVNIDLAKAIPEKLLRVIPDNAFVYLGAVIPGLFFEVSIVLGNPDVIAAIWAPVQAGLGLNGYVKVGIVLLVAFIVGNVFTLLVCPIIQNTVRQIWKCFLFIWAQICRSVLFPFLNWILKHQFWKRHWVIFLLKYATEKAFPTSSADQAKGFDCWRVLAGELLRTRYGVKLEDLNDANGERWLWVYRTIGWPTAENMRGSMVVIIVHATGWSGLAATRLAPGLQQRFYLGFCFAMIAIGLYHDWWVARNRLDPVYVISSNIRALLREYGRTAALVQRADRNLERDADD